MKKRKLDQTELYENVEGSNEKEQVKTVGKGKFEESGEVYDPYAMSKSHKLPVWFKACFTKWWVAGMVFYFIFFGIGDPFLNGWIFAVVLGVIWGAITDVFVNHAFRGFDSPTANYKKYIFLGRDRGFITLPANVLYGAAISYVACIEILYNIIYLIQKSTGANPDDLLFFAGPFVYAFLMLGLDMACVAIRNAVEKSLTKRRDKIK